MARSNITMTGEQWMIVWTALANTPGLPDQSPISEEEKFRSLYLYMKEQMKLHRGTELKTEFSIQLSGSRKQLLVSILGSPRDPWKLGYKYEIIWPIKQLLGWTQPNFEFADSEED